MTIRPEVQWFAEQMERVLRVHDHKGHWEGIDCEQLFAKMIEEVGEVGEGFWQHLSGRGHPEDEMLDQLVDVANLTMMLSWNMLGEKEQARLAGFEDK